MHASHSIIEDQIPARCAVCCQVGWDLKAPCQGSPVQRSEDALLLAVGYAEQRHAQATKDDVVAQLTASRMDSGYGLLPDKSLRGWVLDRFLSNLNDQGLVRSSRCARDNRTNRWFLTELGHARVETIKADAEVNVHA